MIDEDLQKQIIESVERVSEERSRPSFADFSSIGFAILNKEAMTEYLTYKYISKDVKQIAQLHNSVNFTVHELEKAIRHLDETVKHLRALNKALKDLTAKEEL